jgi:tetratricopeptide (TPR) repeat protein
MATNPQRWAVVALGLLLLALAWLAYRPGLTGGFLFDDFVNLDALGRFGVVDNWGVFWRYMTSGTADPLGRPIALLSFLFDARNWPADPAPFLRTNVLIHLTNGALLFGLLRQLGRALDGPSVRTDLSALFAAGCWLLHPLFVSTTLYVVQRQAMLPASFTLLGLIAYGHGRAHFQSSGGISGLGWMLVGIVCGTTLAILCKANGVLLPLLALILEVCVFQRQALPQSAACRLRWVKGVLLVLPSLFVLAYVLEPLRRLSSMPGHRSWTIGERLLTESRVLVDYLKLLVVPRSVSTGLFNDGYVVSHSIISPWTTLPSLLLVLTLPSLAFIFRRRYPALSCGLLFFFVGHLLESTSLPLELYFEHRNYLPALLLFWPLGRALLAWSGRPIFKGTAAMVVVVVLAGTTWQRAELWGQPQKLARLWAASNHNSARAQTVAALTEQSIGRPDQALERLLPLWRQHPYELQYAFNVIDGRCTLGGLSAEDKLALTQALRHTPRSELMTNQWLSNAIEVANDGRCRGLVLADVDAWLTAALENPVIGRGRYRDEDMEPLLGQIAVHRGEPNQALTHLDRALRARPSPDQAARQAVLLASNGYYQQALAHLDTYDSLAARRPPTGFGMSWLHRRVLDWQGYWPREMALLRAKIKAEMAKEPAK